MAIEQNNITILQHLKLKRLKENNETNLLKATGYQHYSRQFDRLSIIDQIITRQYFDETVQVNNNQILLPKHLITELLESFHGKVNKHSGISKTLH